MKGGAHLLEGARQGALKPPIDTASFSTAPQAFARLQALFSATPTYGNFFH
jgi:hypothetical protein